MEASPKNQPHISSLAVLLRHSQAQKCLQINPKSFQQVVIVTDHMRILPHTRMGWPIRVRDSPYVYGAIYVPHMPYGRPIRVWGRIFN